MHTGGWVWALAVCAVAAGGAWSAEDEIVVVHFGDSTCITSYLKPEQRVDTLLNAQLKAHYKTQKIVNHNAGLDGDFIRQFLDGGRYEKAVQTKIPRIDVALIRYGQNDMKRFKPEEFKAHLIEFCDRLLKDYPGVTLVLESNTAIDTQHWGEKAAPRDFNDGSNRKYNEYWEISRQVARERGYTLVDVYERLKAEILADRWDLRIRNQGLSRQKFGDRVFDASKDAEMKDTPNWFFDSHPNAEGVKVIADEEFKVLTKTWPERLPSAKR
ncbi:MAG: SGNH/GDSL hydrolase family protein [Planctomycetes bacterium]|nr:SGNH/GDSL hydrolase family protein [Planctomycetota bacterium]